MVMCAFTELETKVHLVLIIFLEVSILGLSRVSLYLMCVSTSLSGTFAHFAASGTLSDWEADKIPPRLRFYIPSSILQ